MKTVLVTGGTGFIGRHVVSRLRREPWVSVFCHSRLRSRGHPLLPPAASLAAELTDEAQVARMMRHCAPDVVIHLAANPTVAQNATDPCAITRDNVLATHHVLAHAPAGCRFILASSATVYGDAGWRVCEDDRLDPTSVYGATKVAAEMLVRAYTSLGRVAGLSLRLVANVGAGAGHGLLRDVLRKLQGPSPELELLGDPPGSTKHYVHVSDTAEAFAHFALAGRGVTGAVNVANRDSATVLEVAEAAMEASGMRKPIRWLGEGANWKGDNPYVGLDSSGAGLLGWGPRYPRSLDAVRAAVAEMMPEGLRVTA